MDDVGKIMSIAVIPEVRHQLIKVAGI